MNNLKKTLTSFVLILMMVVLPVGELGVTTTAYAETMVYVTATGSKYHTHKCGNGTFYLTTLSAAKARGLTPCSKCYKNGSASGGSSGKSSGSASSGKSKLSLSTSSIVLIKGSSKTIKAKGASGQVKWSSSNTKVAVVSGGKVTAKGKGKATITASCGGTKKTCSVKVEEPKLSKNSITMTPGTVKTLKLSGCSHDVNWSSSNEDVCVVYDGEIEAFEPGKATIKAKVHGVTYKCKVTVTKPKVEDFSLSEDEIVLDLSGNSYAFLEIEDLDYDLLDYYTPVINSSDENVVTLEEYGDGEIYVYAVGIGEADITVKIGTIIRVCHVVVKDSIADAELPE